MELIEKQIFDEYVDFINNNFDVCKEESKLIYAYLERSPLFYSNEVKSKSLIIPKVYSKKTFAKLEEILQTTHRICEKVTAEYLKNPEYRKLFPFSKELEELILIERGYDTLIPISRYDIFYNEETGDFKFCEFNTDGTSGMDENRVHDRAYMDNAAHQYIRSKYDIKPFELFDSLCTEFVNMYKTWNKAKDKPNVLITDFFDAGRVNEFKEYAHHFHNLGIKCHVCDIRELTYDGKTLYTDKGYPIDAIYRRAVTSDILDRIDLVEPFINAVKDGNVFMCGSFATQLAHNKWIFNALLDEQTKAFLTPEENEFVEKHIPKTVLFNKPELKEDVLNNKNSYILKPIDSYAAHGVYAGVEFDDKKWSELVNEAYGDNYICQDYAPQYKTKNIDLTFGGTEFKDYINMTGLYSYNGKLVGFFNRLSDGGIIRTYSNERMVPTYLINE